MRDRHVRNVGRGRAGILRRSRIFAGDTEVSDVFRALLPGLKRVLVAYQRSSGSGRPVGEISTHVRAVSAAERSECPPLPVITVNKSENVAWHATFSDLECSDPNPIMMMMRR